MPFDMAEEIALLAEAVDRSRVSLLTEAMARSRRAVVDELAESSDERQDESCLVLDGQHPPLDGQHPPLDGQHPPAKADHTEATHTKPGRARGRKGASGRGKSTAMSTPRGSRASALREKASAELRAAFEKQERSLALALSTPPTSQRSDALTPRGECLAALQRPASTPRDAPTSGSNKSTPKVGSARSPASAAPGAQRAAERRSLTPERRQRPAQQANTGKGRTVGSLSLREDDGDVQRHGSSDDSQAARRPGSTGSCETIVALRGRLAAQESSLAAMQSRVAAREAALEATRASMKSKLDRISEVQDSARRQELHLRREQAKFEAQIASWKREKDHMQDRILSLERQLDAERQQRQELGHKLDQKTEELLKEQRARTKLQEELQAAKGDRAKLARTKEELRLKQEELQLTTSQLQKHDLTLRQTHIQFARTEEVSKAEAFEGDVEKFWRNRDVEAIVEGMQRYQRHVSAVLRGFMALTSLAHDRPELQQQIATVGGIKCTCEAMRVHSTSASLQLQAT